MTLLWRICFSFAAAGSLAAATVSGSVALRDSRDPMVRQKKDYSGVVVWLDRPGSAPVSGPPAPARMIQKDKTFMPHVLAVQVGSKVEFPNFDPIFHNAFSNYDGQLFDVGLYPPGSSRSVRFDRVGFVRVFCNIHANMSAVIAVVPTATFAVSGKDGSFTISGVEPGEYTLRVFHERASEATLASLTQRIMVGSALLQLAQIPISETGYLPIPHKNKYGHEYSAPPDEGSLYPSVRK